MVRTEQAAERRGHSGTRSRASTYIETRFVHHGLMGQRLSRPRTRGVMHTLRRELSAFEMGGLFTLLSGDALGLGDSLRRRRDGWMLVRVRAGGSTATDIQEDSRRGVCLWWARRGVRRGKKKGAWTNGEEGTSSG